MAKRIVSLVLCLIMVLGLVNPMVNAADDSAVSFDNVTFNNVTIDGNTVNSTTSVTSPTQLESSTASTGTVATTAPDCDCGNEGKDIIIHADSCLLKKYYQGICKESSLRIWAMWPDLPTDAREYILTYLSWTDNAKLVELEKRLSASAFAEDSIITDDGTDITAVNVPEYGSLQATAPSSAGLTAVEQYASEQGWSIENKLFAWDISVVTTSGQEWQPNGTAVKLELDVPGVKLHKYATVYVVHVDDAGNATQIPARVTEEGKVAFETNGFSTFAGFTVDFAFNGGQFSIPGETSIKLSEVFDQLKMPLYVSDVANVTFTNDDLVTVEKQSDGDWLLTSLVAFTSEEKLTVTMVGGEVYVIDVTDATYVTISYNNSGNQDDGTLGEVNWFLKGTGSGGQAYSTVDGSNYARGWTEDYDIYIDGTDATDKEFEIILQRHEDATGRTLYVDLHTVWVKGGANLIFRLGGTITKENTDQVIVRQVRGHKGDTSTGEWWFNELFWVEEGSLNLLVPYTAVDKGGNGGSIHEGVQMVFDWDHQYYQTQMDKDNAPKSLVNLREKATSFKANQCVFRDVGHTGNGSTAVDGAEATIVCRSADLSEFTMTYCEFKNTNKSGGNGSAIYVFSNCKDETTNYVQIHHFSLTNCDFNNCSAGAHGGAVSIRGYVHNGSISNCTFTDCTSKGNGGAVELAGSIGSFSFSGTTFTDCTAAIPGGSGLYRGGAVAIYSIGIENGSGVPRWTRSNSISFSGCTFTNCDSLNSHGGGIGVYAQVHTLTVSDCDFIDCDAKINGGGISIDCADLPDTFKDTTVTNYPDWTAGISSCATCAENDHTLGTVMTGNYDWGTTENPDQRTWINNVSIDTGCTFTNCTAIGTLTTDEETGEKIISEGGNGGAIEFAAGLYITDHATVSGVTIDGCKSLADGYAIFWSGCYVEQMNLINSIFKNCIYTDATSPGNGGTVKTTGPSCLKLDISGCTFEKNHSLRNGGGLYWNAGRIMDGLDPQATVDNCTFDGNRADVYGGGIYVESKITVTKCHIKNNTAGRLGGGIGQQVYDNAGVRMLDEGGATELKLDPQTWIHHNTAPNGGGISIRANATTSIANGSPIEYTVRFELNGAAVYENTATNNGGGIYFIAETYTAASDASDADKLKAQQNQAEVDKYTKVILINAGTGTAAAVYKNTANNHGGGIYMQSSNNTSLKIQGGYISSNKADHTGTAADDGTGYGGGIYLTGENAKCIVTGGIVGGEGNDSSGDPLSNTASKGGGIAISGGARIEMSGGEISYNNVGTTSASERQGGGIWLDDRGDNGIANTMTLSGGTVKNNSTPGGSGSDGGGIFVGQYGEFTITNGFVQNNTSNSWGGGLYAHENSLISVSGGEISGNTANGNGGGIYAYLNATISVSGGEISNNTAQNNGDGGGIYASSGSVVTVSEGAVQNNNAYRYGGGVYANDATVTVANAIATADTGGSISGNISAERGGGIAAYNGSTVTVSGGSVQGNWSKKGGGLYANASTITVNGGSISENGLAFVDGETEYNRTEMGGGIYGSGAATITVNGGNVFKNEAGDGGGVWIEDANSTLSIYGGIINENTATDAGGGVGVDNQATATIAASADGQTHGTISHNQASRGGGVYVGNGADLTVTNGYITYNTASGKPSGVTTANGLSDTLKGTGGGVYIANGTSSNSTTFTLNGESYAIYGNLADFAADDVFANGSNTKLTVPTVASMDLSEYKFKPEGWFEDYPTDDTAYSSGLNLAAEKSGIGDGEGEHVYRYRFADPLQRVLISDDSGVALVNTANKYVAMTLGMPTAVNDTVVIDYGKPVDIHVLTNEVMYVSTPTLIGIGPLFNHVEGVYGYEYDSDPAGYGATHPTSFGSATIQDQANGVVRFSINTMSMDKEVAFSYVVKYTNSTTKDADGNEVNEYFYYYADVTIIPATTIYYEDDFQIDTTNGIQYGVYNATTNAALTSGGWTDAVDGYTDNTVQNEDRPGDALLTAIDKDNVYGYDSNYETCLKYSLGNAKKVTVDASKYATATFSFYGTGFDVISMTSANTGTIGVIVSKYSDDGSSLTVVENYLVDTYYGYKFEGGKWVVDTESTDSLYQVPVIKVNCKDGYGHYQVKIVATYADFFNHKGDGSYDFYLDAIRIYDPANDGTGNTVIQGAYTDDGEGWPSYKELRNMLIDQDKFNSTGDTETINGVVFIDGIPSLNGDTADQNTSVKDENKNEVDKTAQIKTYMNFGPNNELYLAKGQAVAFTLDNPATLASVQIAMKSVGTSSVPVKISYYDATNKMLVDFKEFVDDATTTDKDESIATATDLYYDISGLAGRTVVIQNMSTTDGPILSITNIKTTYTEQPTTFRLLRTTTSEVEGALAALNAVEEEAQPEQQPGENTPEQNVPGSGVEENPVTGDMAIETLMLMAVTACVMMLAVLALPKARKRNAK